MKRGQAHQTKLDQTQVGRLKSFASYLFTACVKDRAINHKQTTSVKENQKMWTHANPKVRSDARAFVIFPHTL